MTLHTIHINNSKSDSPPIFFLHGFGGVGAQWRGLQTTFSFKVPTVAFDLPGHGQSLHFPNAGPPKVAAKAILTEMGKHRIPRAHFVGHSMGGAISSLVALMEPEKVASLTLLAPGGFGEEFNLPLLKKWALAKTEGELAEVLPQFFGPTFKLPQKIIDFQAELRKRPGAVEKLKAIADGMSSNGKQGVLPVDEILGGPYNVSVIWGEEDNVLPVTQAYNLKDKVDLHIVKKVGHSPAEEATDLVKRVVTQNCL